MKRLSSATECRELEKLLAEKSISYKTKIVKKRNKRPPLYIVTIFLTGG